MRRRFERNRLPGSCRSITLVGGTTLPLDDVAVTFRTDRKEFRHPNTVELRAFTSDGGEILERRFFSVGGGFVEFDEPAHETEATTCVEGAESSSSHPAGFRAYSCADELLAACADADCTVAELVSDNEAAMSGQGLAEKHLIDVWHAMRDCISAGSLVSDYLWCGPNVLGPIRKSPLAASYKGHATERG